MTHRQRSRGQSKYLFLVAFDTFESSSKGLRRVLLQAEFRFQLMSSFATEESAFHEHLLLLGNPERVVAFCMTSDYIIHCIKKKEQSVFVKYFKIFFNLKNIIKTLK